MDRNNSIFNPIKKRIFVIAFSLLIILVFFVLLQQQSSRQEYEDKVMINVFGKQRMLTQQMSKDANRLYAILQAMEKGETIQSEEVLNQKLSNIRESINQSKNQFSKTLDAMHNGNLQDGNDTININEPIKKSALNLANIDGIWEKFSEALIIIMNTEKTSEEAGKALIYINDNNMELLNLSNNISESIIQESLNNTRKNEWVFYGLMALFVIISIDALFNLLKYIILPFNQLYKGIQEIGLAQSTTKDSIHNRNMMPAVSEINHMFHKIDNLISLIENMNNNSSFMETLDFINETFSEYIPYSYIGIALIDKDKNVLRASYGVSKGNINGLTEKLIGSSVYFEDTSLGQLLESGEARIINDLEEYTANKPLKLYNKTILEAGIRSSITLPLKVSGEPVGVIFFSSHKKNVYNEEHVKFLKTLVNSIAISLNQNIFINDLLYSDIIALAKLAEARDEDTGEHLDRMSKYSRAIAEIMFENNLHKDEMDPEYMERIERFSPLHDIGKVGISDRILLKPGKLTEEEFNEMKRHTTYGAEVLKAAEENLQNSRKGLFEIGIEISESHHEKWDGSGYPYGLMGEEIPLSARIVAVADVLDALTSKRPYKEPFPFNESLQIIENGKGKHFDPNIVDIVMKHQDRLRAIYNKYNHEKP